MSKYTLEADITIWDWEKTNKQTPQDLAFWFPQLKIMKPNYDIRAEEFRFVRRMDTSLRNITAIQITQEHQYADCL